MPLPTTLQRIIFNFTAVSLCCLLTGCFQHFYTTKAPTSANTDQYISTPAYQNRYFILRSGDKSYHIANVVLSEDKKMISGQLDTVSFNHTLHLRNGRDSNMRYKPNKPEAAVLNDVHLYVPDNTTATLKSAINIPVSTIQKVEVIEKDKHLTRASTGLGIVGVVVLITFAIVIISLGPYGGI